MRTIGDVQDETKDSIEVGGLEEKVVMDVMRFGRRNKRCLGKYFK